MYVCIEQQIVASSLISQLLAGGCHISDCLCPGVDLDIMSGSIVFCLLLGAVVEDFNIQQVGDLFNRWSSVNPGVQCESFCLSSLEQLSSRLATCQLDDQGFVLTTPTCARTDEELPGSVLLVWGGGGQYTAWRVANSEAQWFFTMTEVKIS